MHTSPTIVNSVCKYFFQSTGPDYVSISLSAHHQFLSPEQGIAHMSVTESLGTIAAKLNLQIVDCFSVAALTKSFFQAIST
jgi:hypothetical protein